MLKQFRTYQQAVELYKQCKPIKAERYIKDQLMRASLSVVLNLAEGSAKPTPRDRKRYYSISLGSLREVQAILELLEMEELFKKADALGAGLYRLSRYKSPS